MFFERDRVVVAESPSSMRKQVYDNHNMWYKRLFWRLVCQRNRIYYCIMPSWDPQPILPRRKALSISSNDDVSAFGLQDRSPFFSRLPQEIRLMIYMQLVGNRNLHIFLHDRKGIRHVRCVPQSAKWCCFDACETWRGWQSGNLDILATKHAHEDKISFLQTCRRVYSEAIDLMYSTNTFVFADQRTDIIQFSKTVLPQRLEKMTSVRLIFDLPDSAERYQALITTQIERHVSVLKKMKRLRELKIEFLTPYHFHSSATRWILEPWNLLDHIVSFEITVDWVDFAGTFEDTARTFKLVNRARPLYDWICFR